MKRLISLALAAIMTASAFVSCTEVEPERTSVTLASSDAAVYSDWLTDRLGTVDGNVVIGIGSSEEYGIDMTAFEDDGYILRTVGDTTIAFGKTADGLDRAVRKYAKAVQTDTAADLDVVYHEGYRVKKLTVAGRDISEYTIYYPADANANMKFAVSELQSLVKKACGAELKAVEGAPEGLSIEFRFNDDPALESDGYKYTVTENGIVFEGAVKRGTMYAVYRFLQNECGWDCLVYGDSYLNEAELVDVPAGTVAAETPVFEHLDMYGSYGMRGFKSDRSTPTAEQNSYSSITQACHGLQNQALAGPLNYYFEQPCFNDEDMYDLIRENVVNYIEANYDHCLNYGVDIAQGDNNNFCMCSDCSEIYYNECGHAGSVVRFANKLSEDLNEVYPGMIYKIFAYFGTNQPPKITAPNEFVYTTFCYDVNCSNHLYDGSECTSNVMGRTTNNTDYAKWFDGWCALTDNMYVWTYALDTSLQQYTIIDNLREDFLYFRDNDVRGMFHEAENWDLGIRRIEFALMAELNWNPDMSESEYEALICKLLEREYGAGWQQIRNFIYEWEYAQDMVECWQCWGWTEIGPYDYRYNTGFFKDRFDSFVDMFDDAIYNADSAFAEYNVERLSCTMLNMGCYSSYYLAEKAGDTERMAVLSDRYDLMRERLTKLGLNPDNMPSIGPGLNYADTIEEAAAVDWLPYYDDIMGMEYVDPVAENITLATYNAQGCAEWLTESLGDTGSDLNVVMGIGSVEEYGIDMSDFEDDGYILQSRGDYTVCFGKSEEGLDRAARAYTKAVRAGTVSELNTVYHEGYRIERLTIDGVDVSEYAVIYENTSETVGLEIARLIKIACGVDIPVYSADEAPSEGRFFIARQINDPTLGETDCRYLMDNGNVIFEGDDNYVQGVANGVHLFFENECGWDALIYGDSELKESDHVDVVINEPVETHMFTDFWQNYGDTMYETYDNDRHPNLMGLGRQGHSCHGMSSWIGYIGNHWDAEQICYTDDGVYEEIYDKIYTHLQTAYPGRYDFEKDPVFIDVSHLDSSNFCTCTDCMEVFVEEGGTFAGPVVRWANRLAEDLNTAGYNGVQIGIFAYSVTKQPCITPCHEDVYVTFCTDVACQIHPLDSGECVSSPWYRSAKFTHTNADYANWISAWSELTDNIFIWYYTLDHNFHQYYYLHQFYDDLKYFSKQNIIGFFWEAENSGQGLYRVMYQLGAAFNRNPDMTEEEYWELAYKYLEKQYGDGWEYVLEFIELHDQAEGVDGICIGAWNYGYTDFPFEYDVPFYRANWKVMMELLEKAKALANTAKQEKDIEILMISVLYVSCGIEYFDAKNSGDTEAMAELEARYAEMIALAKKTGISLDCSNWFPYTQDKTMFTVNEDIHLQANLVWSKMYEIMGW